MKARVKTKYDYLSYLETSEIARVNKIWMVALNQELGIGAERLLRVFEKVCSMSSELYEDPERWMQIDDIIFKRFGFDDFLPREDLDEREEAAKEIHKLNGKKWRDFG